MQWSRRGEVEIVEKGEKQKSRASEEDKVFATLVVKAESMIAVCWDVNGKEKKGE
jgi:hypothetical protein